LSLYQVKIIFAVVFLGAAFMATAVMLEVMGRAERKEGHQTLRKFHKSAGWLFAILLLPLLWIGAKFAARAGDQLPLRGVLHAVLALFLITLFILKATFVRRYRSFLKHVPVMGLTLFVLTVVIFMTSAGFYVLKPAPGRIGPRVPETGSRQVPDGDAQAGASLFSSRCASCHRHDVDDADYAPGLKGVLKKPALPSSGRPATPENIRALFFKPVDKMPSFAALSEKEMADIIAYLKTL